MKDGLFEVGDIVKGLKGNRYWITNEKMTKAIVVEATKKIMMVEILEHTTNSERNKKHYVGNNTNNFELITEENKDFWEDLEVL